MKFNYITISLLITISFFSGCYSQKLTWSEAKKKNTIEGYRRFIFESPEKDEVFSAKQQLERLIYIKVIKSGNLGSLILFLHEFPNGKFSKIVRKQLERKRAKRAIASKGIWPLIRFLHYHPQSSESSKIKKLLETRWWKKIKKNPTPEKIRRYLDFFPKSIHFSDARTVLSELEFKKLGKNPDPESLRLFAAAFPDTKKGEQAKLQFKRIQNIALLFSGSFVSVVKLIKEKKELPPEFIKLSLNILKRKEIFNLDFDKLTVICDLSPLAGCNSIHYKAAKRWKRLSKSKYKKLKSLVLKASNWTPPGSLRTLAYALESDDLRTVKIALDSLVYLDEPSAFSLISSKIGNRNWAISWSAENAVKRWYKRNLKWRNILLKYELAKIKNKLSQPEFLIRSFILSSLTDNKDIFLSRLLKFKPHDDFALQFEFLKLQYLKNYNNKLIIKLINKTIGSLKSLFPIHLTKTRFFMARSIARKAYILKIKLGKMKFPETMSKSKKMLYDQVKILEEIWNKKLSKFNTYVSSDDNPVSDFVKSWETSKIIARNKLIHKRGSEGSFWKTVFNK